jgi:uncharacterized membrane protein YidH (DUF202 family)
VSAERPSAAPPGLQPERTALAWRRTALAFMVGPAVGVRVLVPSLDVVAFAAGLLGVLAGVGIVVGARNREQRLHRALADPTGSVSMPDGRLLLLVSVLLVLAGVGAAAALLA